MDLVRNYHNNNVRSWPCPVTTRRAVQPKEPRLQESRAAKRPRLWVSQWVSQELSQAFYSRGIGVKELSQPFYSKAVIVKRTVTPHNRHLTAIFKPHRGLNPSAIVANYSSRAARSYQSQCHSQELSVAVSFYCHFTAILEPQRAHFTAILLKTRIATRSLNQ